MDNLYAQLIEQVKTLAEDFFAEVSVDSEGKGRHVSIFIQVRRSSENSWAILWARNTAAPGKPVALRVLNKGTGASYPVGTFSTVKEPLRGLCRAYERQLGSIREPATGAVKCAAQQRPTAGKC